MIKPNQLTNILQFLHVEESKLRQEQYQYRPLSAYFVPNSPGLPGYAQAIRNGVSFDICPVITINTNDRLEVKSSTGLKKHQVRRLNESLLCVIIKAARQGIPVGLKTQEWMEQLIRCPGYQNISKSTIKS